MKHVLLFATILLYLCVTMFPPASPADAAAQDTLFKASIDAQRTLHLEGTDEPETIIAEVAGDPATVAIEYRRADGTGTPQTASFPIDAFDRLVVNARGGADFVNIIDGAELLSAQKKILKLDGGDGNNVAVLSHLPFRPETAAQIAQLLNLSKQIEDVARRASEATSQALTNDAMKFIESVRVNLTDVSQAMTADAEKQLLAPARQLVEGNGSRLGGLGDSIIAKAEDLARRHESIVADLTKQYDPTNGVFPPDDNREQAAAPGVRPPDRPDPSREEREANRARARVEQTMQEGLKLGADAKAQVERMGKQMESGAAVIEQRANEFARRLEQLSTRAEELAARGEKDLTAAADRVLAVVAELKPLEKNFLEAGRAVREEFLRALSLTPAADQEKIEAAAASTCSTPIATTHTFTGGDQDDYFFPFSAPWQSWSINGGGSNDFLVGGFVADDIYGGTGDDSLHGWKGNDHIRGEDGTDLMCGEFLFELPFNTGNDCIWGGNGIDFVVGDNFFGTQSGPAIGDDYLWGEADTDFIISGRLCTKSRGLCTSLA